ncbi:MAG TPA: TIGR02281 family clan AA aspartic protease [Xanthobacteraceae bacterium]|nr:TIGR02281 family clan AA aspartic protease [Xanthobacteraceae bacterium]
MPIRGRLFWIFLLGALAAFAYAALRAGGVSVDQLTRPDFSSSLVKIGTALAGAALLLGIFRERASNAVLGALAWLALALALLAGYTYRIELRDSGDRVMAELIPGWTASQGRMVRVARGGNGDFAVNAQINGARISMVLDSGASAVVLTQDAAKAAGLPLAFLDYSIKVDTANGRARAAPVTLDRLAVGGITERSVPALIAEPGQLKSSLLGMSFLDRLESWEVRGDRLMMRGAR